jgi:hypothetical protein
MRTQQMAKAKIPVATTPIAGIPVMIVRTTNDRGISTTIARLVQMTAAELV